MTITYQTSLPEKKQFYSLFRTTGWKVAELFSEDKMYVAITNSWYTISAYDGEKLVGFVRVISDGIYQCYIGDMIVEPDYQRRGIGSQILKLLLDKCKLEGMVWVQLTSAIGKAEFYHLPKEDSLFKRMKGFSPAIRGEMNFGWRYPK
jgi:GNAT superfamily N-acetyltransferase